MLKVVMLMEALRYRIKLPFFGAHHIRTFAGLHGEAMCLGITVIITTLVHMFHIANEK